MTSAHRTSIAADPDLVLRMKENGSDIVMLPLDESAGVGCYSEASVSIPKQAITDGMSASFLHESSARTFELKKSSISDAVLSVFLGIASNGGWDWMVRYFETAPHLSGARRLKVKVYEQTGEETRAWEVSGSAPEVVEALRVLRNGT